MSPATTVHDAFAGRARAHPEKPALIVADGRAGAALSYAALAARADAFANALGARVSDTRSPVMLVAEDSPATVALERRGCLPDCFCDRNSLA